MAEPNGRGCAGCGAPLTGRQRTWCGPDCQKTGGRAAWLLKTYGVTLTEWSIIWEAQGRVCGVCHREPRPGEQFHLDHEHRTGQSGPLRGILCPYCNTRLVGRLKSHERAQALADYLRHPPALRALGREVIAPGRSVRPRRRGRRKAKNT